MIWLNTMDLKHVLKINFSSAPLFGWIIGWATCIILSYGSFCIQKIETVARVNSMEERKKKIQMMLFKTDSQSGWH